MKTTENFIALGGCHVGGFGALGEPSFIDIIETKTNSKCVYTKAFFQLKYIQSLNSILNEYPTNLVVLQLGNYEFNPALDFRKYINKKNKTKNQSFDDINPVSDNNHEFYEGQGLLYRKFLYFIKTILSPAYWYFIKRQNNKYFIELHNIIKENYNKDFVIITPLPIYHNANNIIRKKAISMFEHYFLNLPNVIFVNSFEDFPINKEMFYNPAHLSAKGHNFLGEKVSLIINEYYLKAK